MVTIPSGSSTRVILEALEREGLLRDWRLGLLALKLDHRGKTLKAGEYQFKGPLTPEEVVGPVVAGNVLVHRVTVPEGLTADEVVDLLATQRFGTRPELAALVGQAALFPGLPREARSLEGFLFPDTYSLTRSMSPREVLALMTREHLKRRPADFASRARARGLTELGAVTLASLVEKETSVAAERPLVAAVYLNRLARGMLLQADPTTVYALKRLGRWRGSLARAELVLDDPYNTYVRPGLPPGPICNPGAASLEAAVSPADLGYLYFVAAGDGTHRFASAYEEQQRNVARYLEKKRSLSPRGPYR